MKKWMMLEKILSSLKTKMTHFNSGQRRLAAFFILLSLSLTLLSMSLINFLLPFITIPSFSFNNMIVTDLDETSITIDLSLNLSKPVANTVRVELLTCRLNLLTNENRLLIASGKTLYSFLIPRNLYTISNISLKLDFSDIQLFFESLTNKSLIEISCRVYFAGGFSHRFSIGTDSIGGNIIPDFELLDIHPIPPGNILEANVRLTSSHRIILNVTRGTLTLKDQTRGLFGTATFSNVSIPHGTINISLFLNMNPNELEWMFEKIINNNTFSAEILNFNLTLKVSTKEFSIFLRNVSSLELELDDRSLEILGIESITYSENLFAFDLILGLRGHPLWGYNLTNNVDSNLSISLDFYHKLLNDELQLVGNGSSNKSISIEKNALVSIPIHVVIFPYASAEMLIVWLRDRIISINIKNGLINLQMYDIVLSISFEEKL